jgi:decaprenylphospho-beta-D-erythro-pentofuranosid-2-ulose 2-reductase
MKNRHIIIFGATSSIAQAVARESVNNHTAYTLVARNSSRTNVVAADLLARGAREVRCFSADLECSEIIISLLPTVWPDGETVEFVLIAHGVLPDERRCSVDAAYAFRQFKINACGVMVIAQAMGNRLLNQGGGVLVVLGSVAGDRGRQSNYYYGSAKAALDTFLSGLRHRLWSSSVTVLLIKPGMVDTPMTAHIAKGPLFSAPSEVAHGILEAIRRRKTVAYVPGIWWSIMKIVCALPDWIFYRTRL